MLNNTQSNFYEEQRRTKTELQNAIVLKRGGQGIFRRHWVFGIKKILYWNNWDSPELKHLQFWPIKITTKRDSKLQMVNCRSAVIKIFAF